MKADGDESRLVSNQPPGSQMSEKRLPFIQMIVAAFVWGAMAAGILLWTLLTSVRR